MTATLEGKPCRKCGSTERYESDRRCVACRKASYKAYREANDKANAEKEKARHKAYYKANAEKVKASCKAYREANAEKVKAREKAYRKANADKVKASCKAYREANAEKEKARSKAYKKAKTIKSVPEELRPLREKQYNINSALLSIYKQRKQERNDDEQQATQPHDP